MNMNTNYITWVGVGVGVGVDVSLRGVGRGRGYELVPCSIQESDWCAKYFINLCV